MKCQRCPKQATLHITEVLGEERFEELHLCEDCAKKYLYEPVQQQQNKKPGKADAHTDDPASKQCEACGVKFVEFRNTGRLGCPHDYEAFREELLPLVESIHGDTQHVGKSPRRLPKTKSDQIELADLRKRLQKAVLEEDYEVAARLRDRIRQLEEV